MAIIGEIIKKAIELSHNIIDNPDPVLAQEKVLVELLENAKNTSFGKAHGFKSILSAKDLQKTFSGTIPYYDYDRIYKEWWKDVYEGKPDITWPGKPDYFALTSGTTSNTKSIPVTDDMLVSIRNAGIKQLLTLAEFDMPPSFFEKEILMLGSSTQSEKGKGSSGRGNKRYFSLQYTILVQTLL
jgi:acyl-CoA synthetase (AMP-forming)/AMP-acid ligase II